MDASGLLANLGADGPRLAAAARRAGWDTDVPGLDWTVRELVVHTGGVQRWATATVIGAGREAARAARAETPGDTAPDEWFLEGHQALVAALAAAPDDLDVWTFGAGTPREFWIRRQAHELAIHRADAELAAGESPGFHDEFAQDGIAELVAFAAAPRFAVARAGTIGLDAGDGPSWLITLAADGNDGRHCEDLVDTDVTVRGVSADLYLWLWNRRCDAVADGDPEIAALWAQHVRL